MLRTALRRVLLLVWLLAGSGCSYAFVRGPPSEPATLDDPRVVERSVPDGTSSNAGPIVDTVVAVPVLGAGVLAIVAGAGEKCGSSCYGPSSGATVAIGAALAGLGALALSSAITGYGRTADCRRAREALPAGPTPTSRYVPDVQGLADVRARGNQ